MPTFCRHNRFIQNCPLCAAPEPKTPTRGAPRRSSSSGSSSTGRRSAGVRVTQAARATDDGYRNDLVPGLKASADAVRLADELAFATARVAELAADPPGLFADIALEGDREEATWLAFLAAYLSPLEGEPDPFAGIRAAHIPWPAGELPSLDDVPTGPRTAHDPARGDAALRAYRAWAERAGSQAAAFTGEEAWTPARRFDRVFERLTFPGFHRTARFDLLTTLGRLGLYELAPERLHFGANDATEIAAKRVFGIGERSVLEHRAADLAAEMEVPLEALDLALYNFGNPTARATLGSSATADSETADRIRTVLDVPAPAEV